MLRKITAYSTPTSAHRSTAYDPLATATNKLERESAPFDMELGSLSWGGNRE